MGFDSHIVLGDPDSIQNATGKKQTNYLSNYNCLFPALRWDIFFKFA
jgi:hypothetical protein